MDSLIFFGIETVGLYGEDGLSLETLWTHYVNKGLLNKEDKTLKCFLFDELQKREEIQVYLYKEPPLTLSQLFQQQNDTKKSPKGKKKQDQAEPETNSKREVVTAHQSLEAASQHGELMRLVATDDIRKIVLGL